MRQTKILFLSSQINSQLQLPFKVQWKKQTKNIKLLKWYNLYHIFKMFKSKYWIESIEWLTTGNLLVNDKEVENESQHWACPSYQGSRSKYYNNITYTLHSFQCFESLKMAAAGGGLASA